MHITDRFSLMRILVICHPIWFHNTIESRKNTNKQMLKTPAMQLQSNGGEDKAYIFCTCDPVFSLSGPPLDLAGALFKDMFVYPLNSLGFP